MKEVDKKLFGFSGSASIPGGVKINWTRYYMCYPTNMACLLAGLVIFAAFFLLRAMLFPEEPLHTMGTPTTIALVAVLLVAIAPNAFAAQRLPQWLMEGDTCPAIVIDPQTGRIAVWADMTSDPRKRTVPAIKILDVPLSRATGRPFNAGQRLTAVSTYNGPDGSPHWNNFTPIPVVCATNNAEEIQTSLRSIPDEQWAALTSGLREVPQPPQPSLYFIKAQAQVFS